jgi:hypothetical protein
MDKEDFNNYRPISNLFFMSKIIERIVASQMMEYLSTNDLLDPFQSAYKAGHSTETLLAHLHDHILKSMDSKKVVILVMLDLSSAFDTVNHRLLLSRLATLGISGDALAWFKNYLSNRSQSVALQGTLGSNIRIHQIFDSLVSNNIRWVRINIRAVRILFEAVEYYIRSQRIYSEISNRVSNDSNICLMRNLREGIMMENL